VRRPLHTLTALATVAHHGYELGAGTGLVFQPYLGLGGSAVLWATSLPVWVGIASLGGPRWDRFLAFLAGLSVGGAAVHFSLWPWEARRGLPLLTEAEGLQPGQLPAYNTILWTWAAAGLGAILRETPRGARRWAVAGTLAAVPLRASAAHHFRWVKEQAATHPAWWNRAVRPRLAT